MIELKTADKTVDELLTEIDKHINNLRCLKNLIINYKNVNANVNNEDYVTLSFPKINTAALGE